MSKQETHSSIPLDYEERLQYEADYLNSKMPAGVSEPDCPICFSRRYIYVVTDNCLRMRECECKAKYDAEKAISNSGLTEKLKACTFHAYKTDKGKWQQKIKATAEAYCLEVVETSKWFFIAGQVGCGKTHICTAIMNVMLGGGYRGRYMVWPDEVDSIKGNAEGFSTALEKLMNVPLLYIDDFLKSPNGAAHRNRPTDGELGAAFKLINYRYNRPDKITLFSSEYFIEQIMGFDSGLGSRIYERCRDYRLEIGPDEKKNIRFCL